MAPYDMRKRRRRRGCAAASAALAVIAGCVASAAQCFGVTGKLGGRLQGDSNALTSGRSALLVPGAEGVCPYGLVQPRSRRGVQCAQAKQEASSTDEQEQAQPEATLSNLDPQKAIVRPLNDAAEQFVAPAIWNRPFFRACALLAGGASAGYAFPFGSFLHICSFGVWLGANVWTTFIAGITMFKSLPRQQFGKLQAKLFPKYFQLGTVCTAIMLLTGVRMGLPMGPALASLVGTLSNMLYFEPKATEVMFERYDREAKGLKEPEVDKKLAGQFGKLHGMSSLANLVALVGLVAHGTLVAARL